MKKIINNLLTIIFIISSTLLIISFSIIPCIDRNFYYIQIEPLNISIDNDLKWNKENVKEAYDDIMDFIFNGDEFKTGIYQYSSDAEDHFNDCKNIFKIYLYTLFISLSLFTIILLLDRFKVIKFKYYRGYSPIIYSAIIVSILLVMIGFYALIDFSSCFNLFHMILFPNKVNYIFDPEFDEFIWIFPQQFFKNSGIVIGTILIIELIVCFSYAYKKKRYFDILNEKVDF